MIKSISRIKYVLLPSFVLLTTVVLLLTGYFLLIIRPTMAKAQAINDAEQTLVEYYYQLVRDHLDVAALAALDVSEPGALVNRAMLMNIFRARLEKIQDGSPLDADHDNLRQEYQKFLQELIDLDDTLADTGQREGITQREAMRTEIKFVNEDEWGEFMAAQARQLIEDRRRLSELRQEREDLASTLFLVKSE
jgi:hypothetical protein